MKKADFRKHILEAYNRLAWVYDLGEFFRKPTRRATLTACQFRPGERVLDVCTGTAELALTFARAGGQTVAVDLTRGMLKVGQRKARGQSLRLIETDATCLPFANRAFDVVALSLGLHHMPKDEQLTVMREMARLAKRTVVFVEWHAPRNPRWQTPWGWLLRVIDESEYIREWVRQDFPATCRAAGLRVESETICTGGFHRITVCTPDPSHRKQEHP